MEAVPKLRRGSSFLDRQTESPDHDTRPQLRRASRRGSEVEFASPGPPLRVSKRLPRAGTFAFGSGSAPAVGAVASSDKVFLSDHSDGSINENAGADKRSCGMCSSCGQGLKAMPPWAPERMKLLSPLERAELEREMQHKEEMGRLEAELRKKRVADMQAVSARLEAKRSGAELEAESLGSMSEGSEGKGRRFVSEEFELESVDLGAEEVGRSNSRRRNRGWTGSSTKELEEDGDDINASVAIERRGRRTLEEDCNQCEDLEEKVQTLEEQLDTLKTVLQMCEQNGDEESEKKGKGWMGMITSAYYGSSAAAHEKQRLQKEVEFLRKATESMLGRLQRSGKQ